jgi:hypothetical protein
MERSFEKRDAAKAAGTKNALSRAEERKGARAIEERTPGFYDCGAQGRKMRVGV